MAQEPLGVIEWPFKFGRVHSGYCVMKTEEFAELTLMRF